VVAQAPGLLHIPFEFLFNDFPLNRLPRFVPIPIIFIDFITNMKNKVYCAKF